jgi:hypothetical protein
MTMSYRVTGDFLRVTYSQHDTEASAQRAAVSLRKKWGWSHPGSEPIVERLYDDGWRPLVEAAP